MAIRLDPERLEYAKYFEWRDNRLQTLFDGVDASQVNGLSMIQPKEIPVEFQFFSAMSRFYYDAALTDIPQTLTGHYDVVRRLVYDWSTTGEYCVVVWDGDLKAVRSDFVFPIISPYDEDEVLGYRFVFPETDLDTGATTGKARVIVYANGNAVEDVRNYYGGMLDDDMEGNAPVPLTAVYHSDTGDGIYPAIADIVREISVRMAFMSSALNSSSFPILQVDTAMMSKAKNVRSARDVAVGARTGLGLIVSPPFIGEEGARYIERLTNTASDSMAYINQLQTMLVAFTGYSIQPLNDTDDIERTMSTAITRVNRLRRSLESTFAQLGVADAIWSSQPFGTRKSRMDSVRQMLEAKIITPEEARTALGVGE